MVLLVYVLHTQGYWSIVCFLQAPTFDASYEVQLLIDNNPLTCDCRDYDIIAKLQIFTSSHWLEKVYCNLPSQLTGKAVSYTLCHSTERTPDKLFQILLFNLRDHKHHKRK